MKIGTLPRCCARPARGAQLEHLDGASAARRRTHGFIHAAEHARVHKHFRGHAARRGVGVEPLWHRRRRQLAKRWACATSTDNEQQKKKKK
jgi:hypothetical protein